MAAAIVQKLNYIYLVTSFLSFFLLTYKCIPPDDVWHIFLFVCIHLFFTSLKGWGQDLPGNSTEACETYLESDLVSPLKVLRSSAKSLTNIHLRADEDDLTI